MNKDPNQLRFDIPSEPPENNAENIGSSESDSPPIVILSGTDNDGYEDGGENTVVDTPTEQNTSSDENTEKYARTAESSKSSASKPRSLRELLSQSIIIYVITSIFSWLHNQTYSSRFVSRFTSASDNNMLSNSAICRALSSRKAANLAYRIKYTVRSSKLLERSSDLSSLVLRIPARCCGAFLSAFGIGSFLIYIANLYLIKSFDIYAVQPLIGILILLISITMLPFNLTLADYIKKSNILRFCILNFFGIRTTEKESILLNASISASVLLGMLLASSTLFISISSLIGYIVIFAYIAVVIKSPETGLLCLLLVFPVVALKFWGMAIIVIWCSFIFKLACGRRTVSFRRTDIFPLLFVIYTFFSELFSVGSTASLGIQTLICSIYLLITLMIRNEVWLRRCQLALTVQAAFMSLYYILGSIPQNPFGITIDKLVYSDTASADASLVDCSSLIAYSLAMLLIPQIAQLLSHKNKGEQSAFAVIIALSAYVTVKTLTGFSWVALLISLVLFLILIQKKLIGVICFAAAALLLLDTFNVISIVSWVSPIKVQYSQRTPLWSYTWELIQSYGIVGIGSRSDAFSAVYSGNSEYSSPNNLFLHLILSLGITGAFLFFMILLELYRHCFSHGRSRSNKRSATRLHTYAGMYAITFSVITGAFENIWANYSCELLFWIILALTVSVAKTSSENEAKTTMDTLFIPEIEY